MIRTLNTAERNLTSAPPNVITLPAATPTILLDDSVWSKGEVAYRRIQNVGGDNLFVSFGMTDANGNPQCDDALMFHMMLATGEQLDCSNDRQIVCGYSPTGTVVCTEVKYRTDQSS